MEPDRLSDTQSHRTYSHQRSLTTGADMSGPGSQIGVLGLMVVAVVAVLALLVWTAMSLRRRARARGAPVFRYHYLARLSSVFFAFACPVVVSIVAIFNPPANKEEILAFLGIHALLGLISFPFMWEMMCFAVVVTDKGLDCYSPWRGWRFVKWEDVRSVSYSLTQAWFVIDSRMGYRFRVPKLLYSDQFLECLENHLPFRKLAEAREGYDAVGRPFPADRISPFNLTGWKKSWRRDKRKK
jgi:hypothetical protein